MADLEKLVADAADVAKRTMAMHQGQYAPMLTAIKETDGEIVAAEMMALDIQGNRQDQIDLGNIARKALYEYGATAYVFSAKLWLNPPISEKEARRKEAAGEPIVESPDSVGALIVLAEDNKGGAHCKVWQVDVSPMGAITMTEPEWAGQVEQYAGPFVGLLDKRKLN